MDPHQYVRKTGLRGRGTYTVEKPTGRKRNPKIYIRCRFCGKINDCSNADLTITFASVGAPVVGIFNCWNCRVCHMSICGDFQGFDFDCLPDWIADVLREILRLVQGVCGPVRASRGVYILSNNKKARGYWISISNLWLFAQEGGKRFYSRLYMGTSLLRAIKSGATRSDILKGIDRNAEAGTRRKDPEAILKIVGNEPEKGRKHERVQRQAPV